jgi:hypothetical protein
MKTGLLAIALAFLTLPALAQTPRGVTPTQAANRAAIVQALSRGPDFTSQDQQYQLLPTARAAQRQPDETSAQQTVQRHGASAADFIETKGEFVVFRAAAQAGARLAASHGSTLYPTALNARTGGIGILPGTLIVLPKNMNTVQAIANDHGLELVRAYAHLKTAFYRVKPGQDLLAAATALAADARVELAEPEVIEIMRVPR